MSKAFSNWKDLEAYLNKEIDDCLNNEVAETIKDEIQAGTTDVVYIPKQPKKYERRYYADGGLGDKSTMKHNASNGELTVTPNAERNVGFSKHPGRGYDISQSLPYNIIKGYGSKNTWYNKPRDFIGKATENIKQNNSHVSSMKDALKKRLGKDTVS